MTIHAMFVYNKKTLIDKILYNDIFNYLDDQGEHISKEKLYEHEKENCPDLEIDNITYDFALNLRQAPCYNSHISVTRSLAVSYIPYCNANYIKAVKMGMVVIIFITYPQNMYMIILRKSLKITI